jgi:hypothetical protein
MLATHVSPRAVGLILIGTAAVVGVRVREADATSSSRPPRCARETKNVPQWALVPDLQIGGSDAGAPLFTTVSGMLVDETGRLFVLQPREARIRVFDAAGKPLRDRGRPGQGPGEFRGLRAAGFLGDTMWVTDAGKRHLVRYSKSGEASTTKWSESLSRPGNEAPIALLADGSTVVHGFVDNGRTLQGIWDRWELFLRVRQGVAILDTIARRFYWGVHLWRFRPEEEARGRLVVIDYSQPLGDEPIVVAAPNGSRWAVVQRPAPTGDSLTEFRVTTHGVKGWRGYSRTFRYRPCPVTSRVRDSLSARYPATTRFPEVRGSVTPLLLRHFYPPVTAVILGGEGDLWIRREGLEYDSAIWQRLDATGAVEGYVVAPPRTMFFAAQRNFLWGAHADEDSVITVQRWGVKR